MDTRALPRCESVLCRYGLAILPGVRPDEFASMTEVYRRMAWIPGLSPGVWSRFGLVIFSRVSGSSSWKDLVL